LENQLSDELYKLVRDAVDMGFQQVSEEDNNVIPALVTASSIIVLPDQNLRQIYALIQKSLAASKMKYGALLYNGYLTLEGKRSRAMFVEGYEEGKQYVWRFAQVYQPAIKASLFKKGQPPERMGNIKLLAGNTELRGG
jgi:hypothetical protein